MNRRNKLLTVAVTVLSLGCNIAVAGEMGAACIPGNMTTPCNKSAWSVEAQAVYLQPSYPDLTNSFDSNEVFPSATTPYSFSAPDVGPDWGWGFFLQGAYSFKNSKDITVDWLRVHNTSSATRSVESYNATNTNSYTTPASFSFSPQLDEVNAVLGQTFNFDTSSSARLYGGIEYARLIKNISNQYADGSLSTEQNSSFNGFGPRVGVDLFFEPHSLLNKIPHGKIYAKGAASILAGTIGSSWQSSGSKQHNLTNATRVTALAPAFEVKLGLQGNFFPQATHGKLEYDISWGWYEFTNAGQAIISSPEATVQPAIAGTNSRATGSGNIGYQGLQFGLRYASNA